MKQYLGGPSTLLSHTQFLQEKFYDLLWIIDKPNDVYTLGRIITLDHRWQTEFGDRWEQKYWARSGIVPDAFITPANYSYDVIIGRDDSITCFKVLTKDKWNRTESKHISTKFPIFLQLIVKKDSIWQMCIIEKNMHIYENYINCLYSSPHKFFFWASIPNFVFTNLHLIHSREIMPLKRIKFKI